MGNWDGEGLGIQCGILTPLGKLCSPHFQVTVQMLRELLSESPSTPWLAVHHLAGAICYGGRVTDAQDMCCLQALLRKFCSPEVFHHHSQSGLAGNKV